MDDGLNMIFCSECGEVIQHDYNNVDLCKNCLEFYDSLLEDVEEVSIGLSEYEIMIGVDEMTPEQKQVYYLNH